MLERKEKKRHAEFYFPIREQLRHPKRFKLVFRI